MIKKTALAEFSNPRRTGIGAIGLGKGDKLMDVRLTDGSQDIVIGTHEGIAIRFHEQEVRGMGRSAAGVRAIRLEKKDRVVGAVVLRRAGTTILVATEKGFGKRSEISEYRVSHRGGKGIITVKTTEKTGKMVSIREVRESDDIVVVTTGGIVIRQHAAEVRVAGRNTQGVRLIKLGEGDTVSDVASVRAEDEDLAGGNGNSPKDNGDGGSGSSGEKKNLKTKTEVKEQAGKADSSRRAESAGKAQAPARKGDGKNKSPGRQMHPKAGRGSKRASSPQQKPKRRGRR
jgi:DNA gyrase subunit A